jgi:tetratricopeptide (TPR) repeat protein
MKITLRPQPIGYFPFPAGLLLLPSVVGGGDALAALLKGCLPGAYPSEWHFFFLALKGKNESALELLTGTSLLELYNRFVLTGDPQLLGELESRAGSELKALGLAVAYTLGLKDTPPAVECMEGELQSTLAMVAAAHAIESERPALAIDLLTLGIDACLNPSPLLAAHLLDQRAQLRRERNAVAQAIEDWNLALKLSGGTEMPGFVAHLHLSIGSALHESSQGQRGALELAAKHYQQALSSGYGLDQNPEMFAWTQQQLALAYLAMPLQSASDQLRMGIAVQSLREALKVYTKETHLELWTTVQLNLANALQYLPSGHPQENLIQAVEIYEELLPFRERAFNPLGYARLLFNQANALAHLGIFQPALEKLNESHKLFHWHGEPKLAANALDQAAHINEMMGQAVTA